MTVQIQSAELEKPLGVGLYQAYVVTDPDHPGISYVVPVERAQEEADPVAYLQQQFARQVLSAAGRPDPEVSGSPVAAIRMEDGVIIGQANVDGRSVEVQVVPQELLESVRDGESIDDVLARHAAGQAEPVGN